MASHNTQLSFSTFPVGTSQLVTIGSKSIAIFRLAQSVHAIDGLCPHRDAPMQTGTLDGDAVVCPWHQWRFRLLDGACTNIPGVKTRTYPVRLVEDQIWIEMP